MLDLFAKFDLNILLYVQENFRTETLTFWMRHITNLGSILLAIIAIWLIIKGSRKERLFGVITVASVLIEVAIVNGFLKNFIARPRPYDVSTELLPAIEVLSDYSFPSGHTIASFEAATVLMIRHKKGGIMAMVLAVLIAFSRLYLYVHYPTDVLSSIVLGIGIAFAANYFVNQGYALYERNKLH